MKYLQLLLCLLFSNCIIAQPYVPSKGLIAYYPFSGNANDFSGNGYNMTVRGAALCPDRLGNVNSAYQFNGIDNIISYADLLPTDTNFTYSCWVLSSITQNALIIHNGNSKANGYGLLMDDSSSTLHGPGNDITIQCPDAGYFGTHHLPINGWHHFLFRVTGNNHIDYYFDGAKTSSMSFSYIRPSGKFHVGEDYYMSSYPFNGKIDDIAVYNRAIDSLEILQLYYGCHKQITTQPASTSVISGTYTQLFIQTSDTFHTIQWQVDNGVGFIDLTNAGPYSGVTTDTLNISTPTISINNTHYRCIVKNAIGCLDTSNTAILRVTLGVENLSMEEFMNVYPIPANEEINIHFFDKNVEGTVELLTVTGQVVEQKNIIGEGMTLNLSSLPKGIYLVKVICMGESRYKKIIKE